jgi:hypothetical protein
MHSEAIATLPRRTRLTRVVFWCIARAQAFEVAWHRSLWQLIVLAPVALTLAVIANVLLDIARLLKLKAHHQCTLKPSPP